MSCSQHELIQAIDNHLQVQFTYNGKLRTFEPYTILESEKDKILIWGHYCPVKNRIKSTVCRRQGQNF